MNKILFAFLTAAILGFAACNTERSKMEEEIADLEKKVVKDSSNYIFDEKVRSVLLVKFVAFADKFPEDKKSGEYLFKAGSTYMGMGQNHKAIEVFNKYLNYFKDGEHAPQVMINLGTVYDKMGNTPKALESYNNFIAKYPEHPLTADVKILAGNLNNGISEDDMIKGFLKKANDSIAQADSAK